MKDEIKEILDNPKILMLSYGNYISLDDYVKLKDYITNLQTIEQQYSAILSENAELENKITNLQKEVRINNDLIPYLKNKEKSLKKQITNLQEENEKLKDDKKKVIEYIKEHQRKDEFLNLNEWETRDLLNILN